MMIFWRSVLSRWSMSAASMPASVTLHSLLLAMHASSGHTPHLRDWKSFSRCHHYFLLFSDKKDNHGFRKYVFVHLSINLATPLALEIYFVNHNGFLCHIFRRGEKYLVLAYVTRTTDLFFSSTLCFAGGLPVVFLLNCPFSATLDHTFELSNDLNFSDLSNLSNFKPCKLYHHICVCMHTCKHAHVCVFGCIPPFVI